MRINKFLANCGIGSRRKVEEYIIEGRVKVNGNVVTNLATDIDEFNVVLENQEGLLHLDLSLRQER